MAAARTDLRCTSVSPQFSIHRDRGADPGFRDRSYDGYFGLIDGILLRPLPFPNADRLVAIDTLEFSPGAAATDTAAASRTGSSYPNFFDWKKQNHTFESLASCDPVTPTSKAAICRLISLPSRSFNLCRTSFPKLSPPGSLCSRLDRMT